MLASLFFLLLDLQIKIGRSLDSLKKKLKSINRSRNKVGTFVAIIKTNEEGKESVLVIQKRKNIFLSTPDFELPGSYTPEYQCSPASFALNELGIQTGLGVFSLGDLAPVPVTELDKTLGRRHFLFLIRVRENSDESRYDVDFETTRALWISIKSADSHLKLGYHTMFNAAQEFRYASKQEGL